MLSCAPGEPHRDDGDGGVHVHRRPPLPVRGLGRLVRGWQTAWRIEHGLSTWRHWRRLRTAVDVIEYPDWGAGGLGFAWSRGPKVAYLHTPLPLIRRHNGLPLDRDSRWASALERFAVRRADVVTAAAPGIVRELARLGWIAERDVDIVPCAVDWPSWRDTAPVSRTGPRVLFVGRLEALKAPEDLVAAMRVLAAEIPGVEAVLVGASHGERHGVSYRASLEADAGAARCRFVDHLPRHRLVEQLGAARVVAVPSRFESFSMVAAEAMAAGRPVVITTTTGIADLVEHADAGAIVPPGNPGALAEALRPFLVSPERAEQAGARGRRAVTDQLDPGRIAALREAVYQRATRGRA